MWSLPIGRKGTKKILFYAESPVKYAMFRPIHEHLKRDPRVEVFFAGKLRGDQSSRGMASQLGVREARTIRRGLSTLVKFDLFVTADYELWPPYERDRLPIKRAPKVQLFHGASVRNGAVHPKMQRYQHLFTVGPYMHEAFFARGIFERGDPRLHKIGMPKTDRLRDGSLDADAIRKELKLDPSRPVVMLAPTWLKASPITRYGEELIAKLADGPWQFLIKLHDKFFDPRFNLVDWKKRLEPYRSRANCRVVEDYDAIPYLWVTDVLISDVSSIANEFALLDRPLVYLEVDDQEALKKRYPNLDLDTWGQRAGEVVGDAARCRAAVERALADPNHNSEFRRALAADVFYNPGHATEPAVAKFYEILELDRATAPVAAGAAAAG